MHYVRCLRPPKLMSVGDEQHIELLFIISTDLGDSLLCPDEPVVLNIMALINRTTGLLVGHNLAKASQQTKREKLEWKSGQRVFKKTFKLPREVKEGILNGKPVEITIGADEIGQPECTAESVLDPEASGGLIMPLYLTLNPENPEDRMISLRKIQYGVFDQRLLNVAEDIGEPKSLARHVWDGGVVTANAFMGLNFQRKPKASEGACIDAFRAALNTDKGVNILELGCGVGVLGLGAAFAAKRARKNQKTTVLMTDLEDAEEQVRGNIARNEDLQSHDEAEDGLELLYENLDWEDGRHGRFGPLLAAHRWDLIMFSDCTYNVDVLPALVETLDALHSANMAHQGAHIQRGTSVFMATKPRHSSEEAVFELLAEHHWGTREEQTIALPVLGAEDQSVHLYLLERN